jgi:hypothetical protein
MSNNELLNSIKSNFILNKIFSFLDSFYVLKLIKHNKSLQLNINFEDLIINYQYIVKNKKEIMIEMEQMEIERFLKLEEFSYKTNFCRKYSYFFEQKIDEDSENIFFLIKYKGFKINDYPLHSFFYLLSSQKKIKILAQNE